MKVRVIAMKEFEVTVTETLQRTVTVEADSKDDATQMVKDMYRDSEIILDREGVFRHLRS